MRPIDADFLIDCIKSQMGTGEVLFDEVMKRFIGILDKTPTIDAVSVVHGKWIESNLIKDGRIFICSNCNMAWVSKKRTMDGMNYCPNCGAKMKGADDETPNRDSTE